MSIEFQRPILLLLIPAVLILLLFSMRFMYLRDKSLRIKQTLLRFVIFTLLILALSGLQVTGTSLKTGTIFVVDCSESVREQQDKIVDFVNDAIKFKKKNDYVGVVAFGKDSISDSFLTDNLIFTGVNSKVDKSATNIEKAVKLAVSSIPEGYAKRVVIISDGVENSGVLRNTVNDVIVNSCEIKTLTLESNHSDEVYVKNIKVPESVGTNEYFNITVEIESNVATNSVVTLYLGRTLKDRREVSLQKGTNTFIFRDVQTEEGLKTYHVAISPVNDTIALNNEYSAYTNISMKRPVLLIEGTKGDASALNNVFTALSIECDAITTEFAPVKLNDMLEYSAIIIANVNSYDLPDAFMTNLDTYIKDYGRGFIACGGEHSFALGGYRGTVLESILPVTMGTKSTADLPTVAMQLVIDESGSMSSPFGNSTSIEVAKQSAIATADTVLPTDLLGVISFSDNYKNVVKLQPATDKAAIKKAISSIGDGGGTDIKPAVNAGLENLIACDADVKHLLLLTDGQDGSNGYNDLIQKALTNNITLSTVAIGTGCNTQLLSSLANSCGGRYYYVNNPKNLPKVFTQEVFLSMGKYIIDEEFTPSVFSDDLIAGLSGNGLPSLKGYIATTIKQNAHEVLSSHRDDPILSYWQYGLGKTVAWTTDVSGKWSGNFFSWDQSVELWNNIMATVSEDRSLSGSYAEVTQSTDKATVTYHTEDYSASTIVDAIVTDSEGNAEKVTFSPSAPGEYTGSFEMSTNGVYSIAVKQFEDNTPVSAVTTAAIKGYSLEYTFAEQDDTLSDFNSLVGGTEIAEPREVFTLTAKKVRSLNDTGVILLVLAALLFIADIAYRRFRFKLIPEPVKAFFVSAFEKICAGFENKKTEEAKNKAPKEADTKETDSENANTAAPGLNKTKTKKEPGKKQNPDSDILDTTQLLKRMKH